MRIEIENQLVRYEESAAVALARERDLFRAALLSADFNATIRIPSQRIYSDAIKGTSQTPAPQIDFSP